MKMSPPGQDTRCTLSQAFALPTPPTSCLLSGELDLKPHSNKKPFLTVLFLFCYFQKQLYQVTIYIHAIHPFEVYNSVLLGQSQVVQSRTLSILERYYHSKKKPHTLQPPPSPPCIAPSLREPLFCSVYLFWPISI